MSSGRPWCCAFWALALAALLGALAGCGGGQPTAQPDNRGLPTEGPDVVTTFPTPPTLTPSNGGGGGGGALPLESAPRVVPCGRVFESWVMSIDGAKDCWVDEVQGGANEFADGYRGGFATNSQGEIVARFGEGTDQFYVVGPATGPTTLYWMSPSLLCFITPQAGLGAMAVGQSSLIVMSVDQARRSCPPPSPPPVPSQ